MPPDKKEEENIFLNFLTLMAVAIDALQGEKGDRGKRGDKGEKGDTGADSTVPGPAGPQGEQGPQGEPGIPGADGKGGKDGKDGKTGPKGPKGDTGPAGPAGKDAPEVEANDIINITTPIIVQNVNKAVASKSPETKVVTGYTLQTGDYTAQPDDHLIEYTSGSHTLTLPSATTNVGQQFTIKNSGTGTIDVKGPGSETVDGELCISLLNKDSATLASNGSNYIII